MEGLGFKELYQVSLKATYLIEVGGKQFEPGETIASFDKISIMNFQEIKTNTSSRGGFDNRGLIFWESTKEVKISFSQGVFSKIQFALMNNSGLIENNEDEVILLEAREEHESDDRGQIELTRIPDGLIFVYDAETGDKITGWTGSGTKIWLGQAYKSVVVDYQYNYYNGFKTMTIGKALTNGYLSLTGKMRVKDDVTGKVTTGIINIPKLRLMSDLSIRVGSDAIPQVGHLEAVAIPEGVRGQSKVMEIIFLNDDIDADM